MRRTRITCAVASAVAIVSLWGGLLQGQVDRQALAGLQARPQVAISISQRSHAVTAPLDIYVQVTNLTQSDIFVKNVRVLMPGEFAAARANQGLEDTTSDLSDQQLKPGYQRLVPFTISSQRMNWLTPVWNRRLLTFVPAEYDVSVRVTYNVPPERPDSQAIATAKIILEPPLSSVLWGGVAGATLLALFVGVYDFSRQGPSRKFWNALGKAVTISAAGSVSAAIAIILLQRLKGLELPINLTVTDFYGGVVVGLFSYKIGDWLHKELLGGGTPDSSEKVPSS